MCSSGGWPFPKDSIFEPKISRSCDFVGIVILQKVSKFSGDTNRDYHVVTKMIQIDAGWSVDDSLVVVEFPSFTFGTANVSIPSSE